MRRVFLGLVVVGALGVAAFVLTRGDDDATPGAEAATARTGVVPRRPGLAARDHADDAVAVEPAAPAPDLSDVSPGVKKWHEPGLPGTFREIVAADDGENVEEKLTYKMRRLRFQLTDAAADCYQGEDSRQQIALGYTLVVSGGQLTVENVRELDSNLTDRSVENCIVGAVKLLSSTVDVPDVRKDQQTVISLHDLYVRNRSVD
jgi:hypothetical protein